MELSNKTNKSGELVLVPQTGRSQLSNKDNVIDKFYCIVNKALTPHNKRIRTSPTKASLEKRLESKKAQAKLKADRKDIGL